MTRIFAALFLSLMFSNFASAAEYDCVCYDTGYECDGYEELRLSLNGDEASVVFGSFLDDKENRTVTANLDAKLDATEIPQAKKGFARYRTGDIVWPTIMIEKAMVSQQADPGILHLLEFGGDGTYSHTWEYECSLSRR